MLQMLLWKVQEGEACPGAFPVPDYTYFYHFSCHASEIEAGTEQTSRRIGHSRDLTRSQPRHLFVCPNMGRYVNVEGGLGLLRLATVGGSQSTTGAKYPCELQASKKHMTPIRSSPTRFRAVIPVFLPCPTARCTLLSVRPHSLTLIIFLHPSFP